jgi:hypothetical protein
LHPHRTLLRGLSCCIQLRSGNELRINAHVLYQRYTSQCLLQPAFDISIRHVMLKQRMLTRLLVAGLLSECCLVCSSLHARSLQSCNPIAVISCQAAPVLVCLTCLLVGQKDRQPCMWQQQHSSTTALPNTSA